MDPSEEYVKNRKADNLAHAQDLAGYFVQGKDRNGNVAYFNLAMAEGVVFHSTDLCQVFFPSGRDAEFKTAKEVQAVRRLIYRTRDR